MAAGQQAATVETTRVITARHRQPAQRIAGPLVRRLVPLVNGGITALILVGAIPQAIRPIRPALIPLIPLEDLQDVHNR